MPKDSYYIKLDTNAFTDPKIKMLRKYCGIKGFGAYIRLILLLREEEDNNLEYGETTWESLCDELDFTPEELHQFIDDCIDKFKQKGKGLFIKKDEVFFSERLNRDMAHLDEIRRKTGIAGRISAEKRYGKGRQEIETKGQVSIPKKALTDIGKMIELYEQKTGRTMTPNDLEVLKDIADNYKQEDFEKALDEAVKNKAQRPITYIAKVLENWKQDKKPTKLARRTYDDGPEGMKIL